MIAILGNKMDLIEQEQVAYEDAKEYAQSIDAIFFYTSAKYDNNIKELFETIA